ncbi:MAG: LLM class F420-dependent oxidoreductase [Acidimicrobiales bacterium]|jgi:probable F420-dependent oxidoreductase|nr:LLM class F420-dependent oxidoreductase [Acidimicrobiaceae bacterium]MDP6076631.1 LLM class F420-dependent oxidoreductase [Acidimicrobiales bacterium]MDP7258107.1 LLM class F420-dependent oxidoreductase [Acidimicrobiales bacterium]HCV36135.1 LLM class F420-dependent oxidoreductase [Acidimicrobiaceae bacterium]HJO80290.1 LLM class F420-dependent oxidoreductase [Acidimicrobiales bacterium]|tara:strand:- start:744 stop:1616 length:873 start_codon:yes stop_codon:yes gene_type:complete
MKVGIAYANAGPFGGAEGAVALGTNAESAGFDSVWTVEHVVYPHDYQSAYPYDPSGKMAMNPDTPLVDPLIWLTWLGANTSTIRLGTGILILPEHEPLALAKRVGTLDELTGGRVELGIGVGWLREEFEAIGVPWEHRAARTDEYVSVLRTLWSGNGVSFDGEFVSFNEVSSNPKPSNGTVPVVVGGHTNAAARRAGRLGDGFFPVGSRDLDSLLGTMRQAAEEHGRDPDCIEVTASSEGLLGDDPMGAAQELAAMGVQRVVVPAFMFWADPAGSLAEFGERIVTPLSEI